MQTNGGNMSKMDKWIIGATLALILAVLKRDETWTIIFGAIVAIWFIWNEITGYIKSARTKKAAAAEAAEKKKAEEEKAAFEAWRVARAAAVEEGERIELYPSPEPLPRWRNQTIIDFWHKCFNLTIDNIYKHVVSDVLVILDNYGESLIKHSLDVAWECRFGPYDGYYDTDQEKNTIIIYKLMIIALAENIISQNIGSGNVRGLVMCFCRRLERFEEIPGSDKMKEAMIYCEGRLNGPYCMTPSRETLLDDYIYLAESTVRGREHLAKKKEQQPSLPEKTGGKPTKSKYQCDPKNPQPMPPEFNKDDFKEALKLKIDKVVKDGEKNKYKWLSCSEGDIIYFKQDTLYETLNEIFGKELDIPEENIELRIKWIYGALRACDGIINWDKMGEPGFSAIPCIVDRWFKKEDDQWLTPLNADWFSLSANILKNKYKERHITDLVRSITPAPPKKGGQRHA
jgi:hypothetical protein